jgi:hypothetical protein
MGTGLFPGVKRLGRGVDHPPHQVPRLKKKVSRAIPLLHLWAFVACYRVYFFFTFVILYPSQILSEFPRVKFSWLSRNIGLK